MIKFHPFLWMVTLYLALHVIYFFLPSVPYQTDERNYFQWASENAVSHTLYPSHSDSTVQQDGIVAPVYINLLVVTLRIWNHPKAIFLLNVILNVSQLFLVYLIARKLFNDISAVFASCVYMLYLNNLGLVLVNLTELTFGVFLLLSIFLFLSDGNLYTKLLSGFSLGLAIGVRPTGWALFIAIVLITCWKAVKKNWEIKKSIVFVLGLCLYIFSAGIYTEYSTQDFLYMSTTGAGNIALGASDEADGQFNANIWKRDEFQKDGYKERNKVMFAQSLQWICKHPIRWISQFPQKIYSTYITDDFAVSVLLLTREWDFNKFVKSIRHSKLGQTFNLLPLWYRVLFIILNIAHQLFYISLLIIFLWQTIVFFKQKSWTEGVALLYLFILIGVAATMMGTIGSLRYKYNFLIISMIVSSPLVSRFYHEQRN